MSYERSGTWRAKVIGSVVILLGVTIASRVVWELLSPLLPVLAVFAGLIFVYWLVILRRR